LLRLSLLAKLLERILLVR